MALEKLAQVGAAGRDLDRREHAGLVDFARQNLVLDGLAPELLVAGRDHETVAGKLVANRGPAIIRLRQKLQTREVPRADARGDQAIVTFFDFLRFGFRDPRLHEPGIALASDLELVATLGRLD